MTGSANAAVVSTRTSSSVELRTVTVPGTCWNATPALLEHAKLGAGRNPT